MNPAFSRRPLLSSLACGRFFSKIIRKPVRKNVVVIQRSNGKEPTRPTSIEPKEQTSETEKGVHFNPCGIQMISNDLHKQIFTDKCGHRGAPYSPQLIEKCKKHLEKHGLWGQQVDTVDPVKFCLPALEGENIDQHFRNIAIDQCRSYKNLMDDLLKAKIPSFPEKWAFNVGWTKYFKDGASKSVPYPEEDALVFDVEVCMSHGQVPTLACAMSVGSWYSWCSPSLVGKDREPESVVGFDELIPLETDKDTQSYTCTHARKWKEKIIIGHNVSYDRAKIKEQYFLEKTKLRFMDTMSLHIAVSGITSFQRALKVTMNSRLKNTGTKTVPGGVDSSSLEWDELSSLNNLSDVHKLYCNGPLIKKDERSVFVKGNMDDVRNNFQSLAMYCANDVRATHEIFQCLLPAFYNRFPHPATLSGMLEMGTTFLPINKNWKKYIANSEKVFENSQNEVKKILMQKADEALKLLEGEKYKEDPWLWDLDWKITKPRSTKSSTSNANSPFPAWYKKLLYKLTDPDYRPGPAKISSSMQVVPKLLRLTWFGFPLHHSKAGKWGFLVKRPEVKHSFLNMSELENEFVENEDKDESKFPFRQWETIYEASKAELLVKMVDKVSTDFRLAKDEIRSKPEDMTQDLTDFIKGLKAITGRSFMESYPTDPNIGQKNSPHPRCEFVPLPHKNGTNYKVGNPLSKDFLSKIEEGVLSCKNGQDIADQVVKISKQTSYWRNNRDRILGQMTVWHKKNNTGMSNDIGAIVPQVVVAGTLTRRAVEPTWMTASNAYEDRIGSELKSMIQAPPSYAFVGADVDSQELWIASVIGDSDFAGHHGSTALGWMTLQGSKSAGTDMHSKTAAISGIGREQAKVLNYARIYGAGVKFAERLLIQFNRNMAPHHAKQKARAMYEMTKGERKYLLNNEGKQLASQIDELCNKTEGPFSKSELQYLMHFHHFPPKEYMTLVERLVWDNGTESYMFNRLEQIAQEGAPRTPILGGLISRSLVPSVVHDDYMTSRVNWVVQSSAVDYLHLMLTCMEWLIQKFQIKARFCISVHDEIRYLVHEEDRFRLALALQITNLLTRSYCSYQLGMYDLPQSVAFFSCVDVDKVLRKEVTDDCVTPSNPKGLRLTYNIPEGEALNIWRTLSYTSGSLLRSK